MCDLGCTLHRVGSDNDRAKQRSHALAKLATQELFSGTLVRFGHNCFGWLCLLPVIKEVVHAQVASSLCEWGYWLPFSFDFIA